MFPAVTICSLNLLNVTTLHSASNNAITDMHILTKLFDDVQYRNNNQACQTTAKGLASTTGYDA